MEEVKLCVCEISIKEKVEINNLAPKIQDSNDITSKYISALYKFTKSVQIQIFALISRLAVISVRVHLNNISIIWKFKRSNNIG